MKFKGVVVVLVVFNAFLWSETWAVTLEDLFEEINKESSGVRGTKTYQLNATREKIETVVQALPNVKHHPRTGDLLKSPVPLIKFFEAKVAFVLGSPDDKDKNKSGAYLWDIIVQAGEYNKDNDRVYTNKSDTIRFCNDVKIFFEKLKIHKKKLDTALKGLQYYSHDTKVDDKLWEDFKQYLQDDQAFFPEGFGAFVKMSIDNPILKESLKKGECWSEKLFHKTLKQKEEIKALKEVQKKKKEGVFGCSGVTCAIF